MQNGVATVEKSMEVPQKVKNRGTLDPAITLLGIYPNVVIQRGTCTRIFIAAMPTIAKLWKEPRCPPTDEWIKKMCDIHNGILCSHQNPPKSCHSHNMNGTRGYYTK